MLIKLVFKFNKTSLDLWLQICDSDANTVNIHAILKWKTAPGKGSVVSLIKS